MRYLTISIILTTTKMSSRNKMTMTTTLLFQKIMSKTSVKQTNLQTLDSFSRKTRRKRLKPWQVLSLCIKVLPLKLQKRKMKLPNLQSRRRRLSRRRKKGRKPRMRKLPTKTTRSQSLKLSQSSSKSRPKPKLLKIKRIKRRTNSEKCIKM